MNDCYYPDTHYLEPNSGLFDSSIEHTYILTLVNSHRTQKALDQIHYYKPTSQYTVFYNKGFRMCSKNLYLQNSIHDINHAYYSLFKHSLSKNEKTILILEDDFVFDPQILSRPIYDELNDFMMHHDYDMYSFGMLPFFTLPCLPTVRHYRVLFGAGAHCIVYKDSFMKQYIIDYENNKMTTSIDLYWNQMRFKKYMFHKPLCYQPLSDTENKRNWAVHGIPSTYLGSDLMISAFQMNSHFPRHGFECVYAFSKVWLFVLLIIMYIVYVYMTQSKKRSKKNM